VVVTRSSMFLRDDNSDELSFAPVGGGFGGGAVRAPVQGSIRSSINSLDESSLFGGSSAGLSWCDYSAATTGDEEDTEDAQNLVGVTFGSVTLWTFPVTIGDNPSVSGGVPISLKYDFADRRSSPLSPTVFDLERYEEKRCCCPQGDVDDHQSPRRRYGKQLLLGRKERELL